MGLQAKLQTLLRSSDFKRFFAIRLLCQSGDGMFQAALATLFFFSPASQGTPSAIAFALFVMLAPFTFVGPFVGVFLDRWQRRNIIVVTDSIRLVLTLAIIGVILTWGITPAVYVLALIALSLNRFLLAALGASLPRVVASENLLIANSILPTIGAAATGVGAVVGVLLGLFMPAGDTRDAATLGLASVVFAASIVVALGFDAHRLGPTRSEQERHDDVSAGRIVRDLFTAMRVLIQLKTPARALATMAGMRLLYGMVFVSSILVARNYFSSGDGTGLGSFAQIIGLTAAGFALAIFVTPLVASRIGEAKWIVVCMLVAVVAQAIITVRLVPATMLVTAFLLGVATQGAKIALDTIIQQDTPDEYRGRAFILYDMLFNIAFMTAGGLCALLLPVTGVSHVMYAALGVGYFILSLGYMRVKTRPAPLTVEQV
ncbi:MFS transporter [Timonella sp. A28]|uniref:MFS transporter n=1 Tax=Timonella sp. A28 TaxID=3442640 RepID=UPI003EBA4A90